MSPKQELSRDDDSTPSQLINALYDAATGESNWIDACNLLAEQFGLWFVQIVAIDKRTGNMRFSYDGGHTPPGAWLSYFTKYHVHNPRLVPAAKIADGEWFHDSQHFDEIVFETNPFYRDFLIPHGGKYCSIKKLSEDAEQVVMLGVHFRNNRPPLTSDELRAIDLVCPHIKRATEIYCRLQRSSTDAFLAESVLDSMNQPIILLDPTRYIHYTNQAARRFMLESAAFEDAEGHLDLRASSNADPLGYALRQLGVLGAPKHDGLYDSVVFRAGGGRHGAHSLVVAIGVRPAETSGVFGQLSRVILMIHPLSPNTKINPVLVEYVYDLTSAEADVAVRIANGDRPQTIATDRKTSVKTIRSQIRSIYSKLGATSPVEVATKMHRMPGPNLARVGRQLILK